MPETELTLIYRLLRYVPSPVRDEWTNVGVALYDPPTERFELRLIESDSEFARLRRVHPAADLELLRALEGELRAQLALHEGNAASWLARLDQTLSGALQLSPQRAVLSQDFAAELDRIYRDQVEPLRATSGASALHSRTGIRSRANEIFRRAGVLDRMERNIRVEEFTHAGDPMRMDYAYRRNGTRGFVQALALDRDPAHAKALAFTGERMRQQATSVEFTAICEAVPLEDNIRHQFVTGLLASQGIQMVPLPQLEGWARDLGAAMR